MKRTIHLSGNLKIVILLATLALNASCISRMAENARIREHWKINPGEEAEDFRRFTAWLAERGGHLPVERGSRIDWFEARTYRCYSNEHFVVVMTPARFCETYSEIFWLAGQVAPVDNIIDILYPKRSPFNRYEVSFSESLHFNTDPMKDGGIYSLRFGNSHEDVRDFQDSVLKFELPDDVEATRRLNRHAELGKGYTLASLNSMDAGDVFLNLWLPDGKLALMKILVFDHGSMAPSFGGDTFFPYPVVRNGSFTVDFAPSPPEPWTPETMVDRENRRFGGRAVLPSSLYGKKLAAMQTARIETGKRNNAEMKLADEPRADTAYNPPKPRNPRIREHWKINPGEEAEDFRRFTVWLSERGGQMPVSRGSRVEWFEEGSYRCYSNEHFVVVMAPARFCETFANITWLAGQVSPVLDINTTLIPASIPTNNSACVFSEDINFRPEPMREGGVYSLRFGDSHKTIRAFMEAVAEQELPDGARKVRVINRCAELERKYSFDYLNSLDAGDALFDVYLHDGKLSMMKIRIHDDGAEWPSMGYHYWPYPVPRHGSFIVDFDPPPQQPWTPKTMVRNKSHRTGKYPIIPSSHEGRKIAAMQMAEHEATERKRKVPKRNGPD